MARKKSDGEAFNRSVAALYRTRMIDDPDERAAMLRTGTTPAVCVCARARLPACLPIYLCVCLSVCLWSLSLCDLPPRL